MLLESLARDNKSHKDEFVFSMLPAPKQKKSDFAVLPGAIGRTPSLLDASGDSLLPYPSGSITPYQPPEVPALIVDLPVAPPASIITQAPLSLQAQSSRQAPPPPQAPSFPPPPTPDGGRYASLKKQPGREGKEIHHLPADSTSRLSTSDGPAIIMDKLDHALTASYDNKPGSRPFRDAQRALIEQGKFKEAMQMDINDIRFKFGNKYDKSIEEALKYLDKLKLEGKI